MPGEATYQIARSIVPIATLALGLALERWRPHARLRPAWLTNLGLGAIGAAVLAVACAACGWFVADWAARRGVGILRWVAAPSVLAVVAGIAGLDAVSYAWHRANHRLAFLWRFHQVHHADGSFHVTTALRFHPGELLLALQRLFVTPAVHRRHHTSDWHELNTNFGTIFSFWDRVAGTFGAGDPARWIQTGLPDWIPSSMRSLSGFLLLPFARGRARG